MNGLLLAQYASQIWPLIAAIITSGSDERSAVDMPIGGVFLAKPYDTARVTAEAGRRTPVAA
jgi:hypothetical protein